MGGFDFNNFKQIIELTEDKCNCEKIIEFFKKIVERYPNKEIIIVLDNASYNHAKVVENFANSHNIELFFLPAYCPNLNLIERLWKFTKKVLVNNEFYESYDLFKEKVFDFFENIENYEEELRGLLTKKFEIIDPE